MRSSFDGVRKTRVPGLGTATAAGREAVATVETAAAAAVARLAVAIVAARNPTF